MPKEPLTTLDKAHKARVEGRNAAGHLHALASSFAFIGQHETAKQLEHTASTIDEAIKTLDTCVGELIHQQYHDVRTTTGNILNAALHCALKDTDK